MPGMNEYPQVDIITVGYYSLVFLNDFFSCLGRMEYPRDRMKLFFVDNDSRDGSAEFTERFAPDFKVEVVKNSKNCGFAQANNMIFSRSSAEFIGLLNPDTRPDKEWLVALVRKIRSAADIGMVCSRRLPKEAPRYIDPQTQEASWCSGGHCLIRREALEKTGYFDEKFFMYGEDVDLSWRMWLEGYRCVYVPESLCEHHFGKEERYTTRRKYFHVRNSILLRYTYGTPAEIFRAYARWLRQGLSLGVKHSRWSDAFPVLAALIGHIPYILHFMNKRTPIWKKAGFQGIKRKWISL